MKKIMQESFRSGVIYIEDSGRGIDIFNFTRFSSNEWKIIFYAESDWKEYEDLLDALDSDLNTKIGFGLSEFHTYSDSELKKMLDYISVEYPELHIRGY